MANNLLVDWLNNKPNTLNLRNASNVQSTVNNNTAANAKNPTTPTLNVGGINLQKAQANVNTGGMNIGAGNIAGMNIQNKPTLNAPTPTTSRIVSNNPAFNNGALVTAQNQPSRFIGFQQQPNVPNTVLETTPNERQGLNWQRMLNGGYAYVPSEVSKANAANAVEENRFRNMSEAFYDLQGDLYKRGKILSDYEIQQKYPEFKNLDKDVLKELQNELLPIVSNGMGVDAEQLSQFYPELLKGKELKDVEEIKKKTEEGNKRFQQLSKVTDIAKGDVEGMSSNGVQSIQDAKAIWQLVQSVKKDGVVGGGTDYEILQKLYNNNEEVKKLVDDFNSLELTEKDKAIWGAEDANNIRKLFHNITSPLRKDEEFMKSGEELESLKNKAKAMEDDYWGQVKGTARVGLRSTADTWEKFIYRMSQDAKLWTIDDIDDYLKQSEENERNVKEYNASVNRETENVAHNTINPDVREYYNNHSMSRSIALGDVPGFFLQQTKSATENIDMPIIIAAGVVAPEVVLPLMATDTYIRESEGAFETLLENGASYDDAEQGAVIVGVANTVVEIYLEKLLGGVETTASRTIRDALMKDVSKKMTEMVAQRGLAELLKQGAVTQFRSSLEEGLEEIVQQSIENYAVSKYNPDVKVTDGLREAFEGGFFNPMNLLAGGGDIISNIDVDAANQWAYNQGVKTREFVDNAKESLNRGAFNAGAFLGNMTEDFKNNVTNPQGGTNNTQISQQQGTVNTTSENQNNINGSNYNQNVKNNKTLNKVQLGMLQNDNRMNPSKITEFKEKFGEDYGQALADRGYTESYETNVPKIEEDTKEIYNQKKAAMNSVKGEFKDRSLRDMINLMLKKAKNTLDYDMMDKYNALKQKHNSRGLTMEEANDMREEYSYKIQTKWHKDNNSDKIDLADNVYMAVKNFLEKTAEQNGIKDLREMNREIAMRKFLSTWIGDKAEKQSANNMVSLTDWVILAEAVSNPYAAAGFAAKKIAQTPKVKNAVLNAVVGRRENRTIDTQNRQAANQQRMESVERANEGKQLQQELSKPETPALPNGIKLTKVTEIDARKKNKPKNNVTKNNNNKKSDSSSSDDGGTPPPSGGTPTNTNPSNANPTTKGEDNTKKEEKKSEPKKAETKEEKPKNEVTKKPAAKKKTAVEKFREETAKYEPDYEGIESRARDLAQEILTNAGVDAEIVDLVFTGSNSRGLGHDTSDNDILIELKGDDLREDSLFDLLNDEEWNDGEFDFNPILADKSGTLEEVVKKQEEHMRLKKMVKDALEKEGVKWDKETADEAASLQIGDFKPGTSPQLFVELLEKTEGPIRIRSTKQDGEMASADAKGLNTSFTVGFGNSMPEAAKSLIKKVNKARGAETKEQPKNKITSKKTEATAPKQEENQTTKIVDKNGNPKTVYHYSDTDFKEFDLSKQKNKLGIYFSPSSKPNSKLRKYRINATINMQNPLTISPNNKSSQIYPELKQYISDKRETEYDTKFRELLIRDGYDGVIMEDEKGNVSQYVVLYPEQVNIKSQGPIKGNEENVVTDKAKVTEKKQTKEEAIKWYKDQIMRGESIPEDVLNTVPELKEVYEARKRGLEKPNGALIYTNSEFKYIPSVKEGLIRLTNEEGKAKLKEQLDSAFENGFELTVLTDDQTGETFVYNPFRTNDRLQEIYDEWDKKPFDAVMEEKINKEDLESYEIHNGEIRFNLDPDKSYGETFIIADLKDFLNDTFLSDYVTEGVKRKGVDNNPGLWDTFEDIDRASLRELMKRGDEAAIKLWEETGGLQDQADIDLYEETTAEDRALEEMYQEILKEENETPQMDSEFEEDLEEENLKSLEDNETPQTTEEEMNKVTKKQTETSKPKNLVTSPKEETAFETLPKDVPVASEAKNPGPKRIAPDRVRWQQLTPEEGIKKVANEIYKWADYYKAWKEWDDFRRNPARTYRDGPQKMADLTKVKNEKGVECGHAVYNLGFRGVRSEEFKTLANNIRIAINYSTEEQTNRQLDNISQGLYEHRVRSDLRRGYVYPQEVIDAVPGASKAVDSRAIYQKGLDTSFSAKDERIDYSAKDKIGGGMKRQDGKTLTEEQKNEIVKGVIDFQKVFGINMKKMAEDMGIVYVHVNGKNVFMSNASGMFRRTYNDDGTVKNASVSIGGVETVRWKDKQTGEWHTETANTIMSHELGHVVDFAVDNKLIDNRDIIDLMISYKKPKGGTGYAKYLRNDKEITARAFEEYMAVEKGAGESYYDKIGYWNKTDFERYVKPIVERSVKEKLGDWYINPDDVKYQKVLANEKNKITTAKNKADNKVKNQIIKDMDLLMRTGLVKGYQFVQSTKDLYNLINGTTTQPRYQSVWHGSPASFDRFDSSHMGEGEGAQAHGWGHYVAVNKKTGEHYAGITGKKYGGQIFKIDNKLAKDVVNSLTPLEQEVFNTFKALRLNDYNETDAWKETKIRIGDRIETEIRDSKAMIEYGEKYIKNEKLDEKRAAAAQEMMESQKRNLAEYEKWQKEFKNINSFIKRVDTKAHLYKVEIPDIKEADTPTGSNYWEEDGDRILSTEELNSIMDELAKRKSKGVERIKNAINYDLKSGDKITAKSMLFDLRAGLGNRRASEFLKSLGYDGIHYFGATDGEAYVIFDDDALDITSHIRYLEDSQGNVAGATMPDGTVIFVEDALRPDTAFHETSHRLYSFAKENSPELYNAIQKIAEDAPQELKDYVKNTYGDLSPEAFIDEVFAWRQGRYSTINGTQTWYQKMWNAIKRLWNDIRSKLGKQYANLDVFEGWQKMNSEQLMSEVDKLLKGGKEIGQTEGSNKLQVSKNAVDSEGKKLTPEQQMFFADSKVRDSDGNLLRLYHGTQAKDFTIYERGKNEMSNSLAKVGFWFTPSKEGALNFAKEGARGQNEARADEVYLNLKNPKIYEPSEFNLLSNEKKEAARDKQRDIYNKQADKADALDYTKAGGFFHDEYDHSYYERVIFQDLKRSYENDEKYEGKYGKYDPEEFRALAEEFNKNYDAGLDYDKILEDFTEYTKAKAKETEEHNKLLDMKYDDPYEEFQYDIYKLDSTPDQRWTKGDLHMALNDYGSPLKLVEKLKSEGYDGIIIKGTEYDGNVIGGGARNDQYVAFDSNQIKRITNENPTTNPDIRYQLAEGSPENRISRYKERDILWDKRNLENAARQEGIEFTEENGGYTIDDSLKVLEEINSKKNERTQKIE